MSRERETDAMSEAVEALARLRYEREHWADLAMRGWNVLPGERKRAYLVIAEADARALLEPRATSCETCWGRVNDIAPGATCKNPECDGGQVTRPSIAVLRGDLEQVGWLGYERDDEDRMRRPGIGRFELIEFADHDGVRYGNPPLYRIASGGTTSGE